METSVRTEGRIPESGAVARDIVQGFAGLLAGVMASAVIFLLAMFSAGAGHGSYMPYIVFIFPLNFGLAVWPLVGLFVRLRRHRWAGYVAVLFLVSYLATVGYHVFVYLDFRERGIEPPFNLFTLLAIVAWLGAVVQSLRLVVRRLCQPA
jgi:hypothetical protein